MSELATIQSGTEIDEHGMSVNASVGDIEMRCTITWGPHEEDVRGWLGTEGVEKPALVRSFWSAITETVLAAWHGDEIGLEAVEKLDGEWTFREFVPRFAKLRKKLKEREEQDDE